MVVFDAEAPTDVGAREALLDRVFGRARFLKTSERLREGRRPAEGLSLVARDGRSLIGTLRLWHVGLVDWAGADGRPALLLGPLAVDRAYQSQGLGGQLMKLALSRAADFGHQAVILVGDPEYYQRFGFDAAATADLRLPGPYEQRRFLARELAPGALDGARGRVVALGAPAEPDWSSVFADAADQQACAAVG